jgi:hypothetical protein
VVQEQAAPKGAGAGAALHTDYICKMTSTSLRRPSLPLAPAAAYGLCKRKHPTSPQGPMPMPLNSLPAYSWHLAFMPATVPTELMPCEQGIFS